MSLFLLLYTDFFRRLSGWFLLLSSIIGFWRVKRWEQTVAGPPATVERLEEDHQLRQNLQRIFGIPITQPHEDNQSRVHQDEENPATPSAPPMQSTDRQAMLTRDLQAAGFM